MAARDSARRDLLELKDQMERSFSCVEGQDYDISLLEGPVADCILECAHNKHADLIVVGTHGRSGIGKVLMGSVAERIFRHSSVPVMTIGPHMHQGALVAKNILLAADFTTASEHASAYASSLAREDGAVLTIVHAVNRLSSEAAADRERVRCAMEEKLAQLLGENKEGLDVRLRIEFGEVVPAILRAATESQADYVVLGVSRELSVFDRFKWPTAYAVVREAHCPVLTVRG
jgi:nucleotide-binding universal stress UspA family protein